MRIPNRKPQKISGPLGISMYLSGSPISNSQFRFVFPTPYFFLVFPSPAGREHIKELGYIQKTKVKLPRPQARIWEVRRTAGTTWGNSNGRHLKIGLIYKYDWKNPISPSAGENQCSNRISYAGHRICAPAFPLRGYQKWRVEIFHT